GALVGGFVGQEVAGLVGRGKPADDVKERPAQVGGVGGGGRGGQAELLELLPDQAVDEVGAGKLLVDGGGDLAGNRDQDAAVGEVPLITGRDGRLAGELARLD